MKYTAVVLAATFAVAFAQVKNYDQYSPCFGKKDKDLCKYEIDYVFHDYTTGNWKRMTCEGGLHGRCQPDNNHVNLTCQQADVNNCATKFVPTCDKDALTCVPPN
ncbi:uncharacterized protein RAG0_09348 [Rhynchosporium agropyri]|uniref:Antifungal protein n=3 Tax=Rhynchosporium TaxID=38037 RepID=A0A1E1MP53_RHYSE|nr:uncharacterized protein RCO7_08777 [Rhynchosporium commune]CZT02024.1 uncharacterized protein RAG0_09348 [Rhynchosporium agropyri]CZT50525.1 uncharacterized protein RSE6_11531 [Rhynchosporium secalis]